MTKFFPGTADRAGSLVRLKSTPGPGDFVRVGVAMGPFSPGPSDLAEVSACNPDGTLCVDWLDDEGDTYALGLVDRRLVEVVELNDPTGK